MKKNVCYASLLGLLLISFFTSCEPEVNPDQIHKDTNRARAHSIEPAKTEEPVETEIISANSSYSYFFLINGRRVDRNNQIVVRAGDHFFVELRFTNNEVSQTTVPMQVNHWSYPSTIRLVRTWTPNLNNAQEFEVVSPADVLPGDYRMLGNIDAAFTPFPSSSVDERKPVSTGLLQGPGGVSEVWY